MLFLAGLDVPPFQLSAATMPHPSLRRIPSAQDFRNATSPKPAGVIEKMAVSIRGDGSLAQIYASLKKLDAKKDEKLDIVLQAVWEVVVDCKEWLAKKDPTNAGPMHAAPDLVLRLTEVTNLHIAARAAFEEMKYKSDAFAANKGSRSALPAIPLEGRHQFERVAYLADDKQAHPPSASILLEDKKVTDYGAFRRKYDAAPGPQTQVQFLRKADRMDFLVVLEGGLFYGAKGTKKDFGVRKSVSGVYGEMYAMDRHGNLFVRDYGGYNPTAEDPAKFNHSSFNAGREVVCAGVALFLKGHLVAVDNASGHYKPSPKQLQAMLVFLAAHGADLTRTRVNLLGYPGEYHLATDFIQNHAGKPAWKSSMNTDWPSDKSVSG
jgi:hypothetical protein